MRYCLGCIVLTWGVLVLCSGIGCWWCGIRVQAEPLHNTRYITPTRLKSAQYSLHNNAPSSRKLLKMDVLTSKICWAVNWHNKASVIKSVYLYSNIKMMHGPIRIRWVRDFFPQGLKQTSLEAVTLLHLVPRLRTSGIIPLIPTYVFIACTGVLPLLFTFYVYVGFEHILPPWKTWFTVHQEIIQLHTAISFL